MNRFRVCNKLYTLTGEVNKIFGGFNDEDT